MSARWGGLSRLTLALGACVADSTGRFGPGQWDPAAVSASLGAPAGDPWCAHMEELRAHLDGAGPAPSDEAREAALEVVRAERNDPLWPFRKALICEYTAGAAEEAAVFEWVTVDQFLEAAEAAAIAEPDGINPLIPVFDHLSGGEPESIAPVDLTEPAYCDAYETADLALSQQRGGVVQAVGFPGSLRRAPDWFAQIQVAYHRWGREVQERRRLARERVALGDAPFHCRRFHAALTGSQEFAIKDNLIFLLPELDDPETAGRLVVRDAEGREIVLDRVLAAAQLDAGGTGGERVDFFAEDLAAAPGLRSAVDRTNALPPPKVFTILFGYNEEQPLAGDAQLPLLAEELSGRDPAEPLRISLSGQADCVGPNWYNTILSEKRAQAVFDGTIRPALIARGFAEDALADPRRFKLVGLGETAPAVEPEGRCAATDENRRVIVVVQ